MFGDLPGQNIGASIQSLFTCSFYSARSEMHFGDVPQLLVLIGGTTADRCLRRSKLCIGQERVGLYLPSALIDAITLKNEPRNPF